VLSKAEEEQLGSEDYSVFAGTPGPHLSKVMRNGGAVLEAANLIRENHRIPTVSSEADGSRYDYFELTSPQSVIDAAVEAWISDYDRASHVILSWKNDNRCLVNATIRYRLGYVGVLPVKGEPLVVRKNVHKKGIMNGDVVRCEEVGPEGPTLAGIPTRYIAVSDDVTGKTIDILAAAGDFSGVLPYVGLSAWKTALANANVDDVVPLTYAYCLTAHLAQGSQYRRVTILSPGDFRNAHFLKMTRLPDGTPMVFAYRWLYTAASRAVKHTSLLYAR
jgi:hypothetical protein